MNLWDTAARHPLVMACIAVAGAEQRSKCRARVCVSDRRIVTGRVEVGRECGEVEAAALEEVQERAGQQCRSRRIGLGENEIVAAAAGVLVGGRRRRVGGHDRCGRCRCADGREGQGAAAGLRDIGRIRQPALAIDEGHIHEIVDVCCARRVRQSQYVAQLMGHGGEQVQVARRGVGGIREQVRSSGIHGVGEFRIA